MPVGRTSENAIGEGKRFRVELRYERGILGVPRRDGRFDCDYHDCQECWLVFKGQGEVMSQGRESCVKPGGIACTRAGDEHDVLEVYEHVEAFWLRMPRLRAAAQATCTRTGRR